MTLNKNKPLPEFVIEYLDYKANNEDCSKNTITAYQQDIYAFFEWIKEHFHLNDVTIKILNKLTVQDLIQWQKTLKDKSASTATRMIQSLKVFFKYLNTLKLINNDSMTLIKSPKIPEKPRKYLNLETAKELVKLVETKEPIINKQTKKKNKKSKIKSFNSKERKERDIAIIYMFLQTGMRISEIVNLNMENIQGKRVYIEESKGDKSRVIFLDDEGEKAVNDWLNIRPTTSDKALFVMDYFNDREPYRISDASVRGMIEKYSNLLGVEFTPHTLRHTFATLQLDAETPLKSIQKALGHSNLKTTEIYAHTTEKQLMNMAGRVKYK